MNTLTIPDAEGKIQGPLEYNEARLMTAQVTSQFSFQNDSEILGDCLLVTG